MEKGEFDRWWKVPPFLWAYLKKELKVNIKFVEEKRFNSRKIMSLLDKGTIVIIEFYGYNSEGSAILKSRNEARLDLDTKEEFAENLKKNFLDQRKYKPNNKAGHPEAMIAYNKYTKEFCIKAGFGEGKLLWYTEEELLKITHVIRYYELL